MHKDIGTENRAAKIVRLHFTRLCNYAMADGIDVGHVDHVMLSH